MLSLLLSTSSFSLPTFLETKFNAQDVSAMEIRWGIKLQLSSAHQWRLKHSQYGSKYWIESARFLARRSGAIAWQLANYYKFDAKKHPISHRNHLYWLQRAITLNDEDALLFEAHRLSAINEYEQASLLFKRIDQHTALIEKILFEIKFGYLNKAKKNLSMLSELNSSVAQTEHGQILEQLNRYQVLTQRKNVSLLSGITHSNCRYTIQFFASNVEDLVQIEDNLTEISKNPFFKQQFCFTTPKYINPRSLECDHNSNERINCKQLAFSDVDIADNVRYLGLVAPSGGAYVDHGMLFIDNKDDRLVIEHELLHLIGFIDEYSLSPIHSVCQRDDNTALANNIVKLDIERLVKQNGNDSHRLRKAILDVLPWREQIQNTTPLTQVVDGQLVIGTPDNYREKVGVYAAQTCRAQNIRTFKPQMSSTQMQYYEENLPEVYQQLAAKQDYLMPSYHYNIALRYKLAMHDMAYVWKDKAVTFEKDHKRIERIKKFLY